VAKTDGETEVLKKNNMKIIPENPTSKDEISLVVYDDCEYNTLVDVKKTAKTIDIEKQFNSQMKLPCVQRNDTIAIGKLPQGIYTVNYKLVDISPQSTNPVQVSITFDLSVTK
jgi:hypothetical protein